VATWVIGDVQGCADALERLLAALPFDPARDRLWFAGDLVNRGPDNLGVLRRVRGLGDRAVTVLGNHDVHLLSVAAGQRKARGRDTLADVLAAPDRDELLTWLRSRPLLHQEDGHLLVHAGLHPDWSIDDAVRRARRAEPLLAAGQLEDAFHGKVGRDLGVFVSIRTVHDDGTLCDFNGAPAEAPKGCRPWFSHPKRKSRGTTVVFGHWAALGLHLGEDAICVDTGCVWGRKLAAVRLEDRLVRAVPHRAATEES
jgi:bis(5'-nucleosyl)-tetraphosphatase (symmetrical)